MSSAAPAGDGTSKGRSDDDAPLLLVPLGERPHVRRLISKLPRLGILLLFLGIAGTAFLPCLSRKNWVDENAISPAQKALYFDEMKFYGSLESKLKTFTTSSGRPTEESRMKWLHTTASAAGITSYVQNFTFDRPSIGGTTQVSGHNFYAHVRAKRGDGKEALFLHTTWGNKAPDTNPLLALSIVKYLSKQPWLARDVFFLITDNAHVHGEAVTSWLEAYYSSSMDVPYGGTANAAIVFETQGETFDLVDIKPHGLEGNLPNMDLIYSLVRISEQVSVPCVVGTHQQPVSGDRNNEPPEPMSDAHKVALKNLLWFMYQQAIGKTTGNHGYFQQFGLNSVTISFTSLQRGHRKTMVDAGRFVEGAIVAMNNILEPLHSSNFFYLLPSLNRFVGMNTYVIPWAIIFLTLITKAMYNRWNSPQSSIIHPIITVLVTHAVCAAIVWSPQFVNRVFPGALETPEDLVIVLGTTFAASIVLLVPLWKLCDVTCDVILQNRPKRTTTISLPSSQTDSLPSGHWRDTLSIATFAFAFLIASHTLLFFSFGCFSTAVLAPVYFFISHRPSIFAKVIQSAALMVVSPVGLLLIATVLVKELPWTHTVHTLVGIYEEDLVSHYPLFRLLFGIVLPYNLLCFKTVWSSRVDSNKEKKD